MKRVAILVPERAVLAAIVDPRYMFTAVNEFLKQAGKAELFQVQLVGLKPEVWLNDGVFSIRTDALIGEVAAVDLVVVPALMGDMPSALEMNRAFLPWIIQQYEQGAELASLCVGAFLLASTGLLNGKSCSTHWLFVDQFRAMFPEVTVADEKVVTEQSGIYSSGGANSYWNLLLHLVEKYTDRETAILAAKFFVIDIDRNSQSPFMIFRGQTQHNDEVVKNAQDMIEDRFQDRLTVDQLAEAFGVGRRTFERRFKKATHNTVIEYIQRVKIEAAKKQFESGRKTVHEVMYDVGYADMKAFRDVFKKVTGMSPNDYRNKYNREMVGLQ
jgi:transcriptional regulator GlxA family with amidase domain